MRARNAIGGVVAFVATYVAAPVLVGVLTEGVNEKSLGGRILNAIYPQEVSKQIVDQPPPPAASVATLAATPAAAPAPVVAAPVPAAPADRSVAMTSTPADAPLKARIDPPSPRDRDGSYVSYSMTLVSAIDALPAFTLNTNSRLEGWSATVKPSNATCTVGMFDANGLTSYYTGDDWRRRADDMTKLGKDVGVSISGTISCSDKVRAGDTITLSARINYIANGVRVPVALYSPPLTLVEK